MEEEYDVVVLGTGLKECILSGLMSVDKKKVLHIDRNGYYGGESASLNLEQLFQRFRPDQQPPKELGRSRDYCLDLCPKFLMATGDLVKVLLYTNVKQYLEFQLVKGSYVFQEDKVHKVPATATEALQSGLMGFFQKRKFRNFLEWVQNYDEKQPKTWQTLDATKITMKQVYDHWSLDEQSRQFTGHAIALQENDDYLNVAAKPILGY
jgi:Rab GDP dissociation inhibitor